MQISHAVRNALRWVEMDADLTMLVGPGTDGALLEIGVLDIGGEDPVVIPAMSLRRKFSRFLARGGDEHATHRRGDRAGG